MAHGDGIPVRTPFTNREIINESVRYLDPTRMASGDRCLIGIDSLRLPTHCLRKGNEIAVAAADV
jgi:hypothetical protein